MRREHLARLLRAASRVVDRRDLLVVGSQSVLGTWDEEALPEAAILSMEADLAVFDDPDGELADRISGAIGELSGFDQSFGYHADGVGLEIRPAHLPSAPVIRLTATSSRWRRPERAVLVSGDGALTSLADLIPVRTPAAFLAELER